MMQAIFRCLPFLRLRNSKDSQHLSSAPSYPTPQQGSGAAAAACHTRHCSPTQTLIPTQEGRSLPFFLSIPLHTKDTSE